jgi:hypothetical protein
MQRRRRERCVGKRLRRSRLGSVFAPMIVLAPCQHKLVCLAVLTMQVIWTA